MEYIRDVNNILIICDKTHINTMVTQFNTMYPTIKFTTENEINKKLNFLDVTIH